MTLQQELRDLAQSLDAGAGKPPFDYDGFRALIDQMSEGKTEEEMLREIEGIRKMIPSNWR